MMFLILVLLEILSGAIFPLDVVPKVIFYILQFTPFPYLVYFPVAIWTGRVEIIMALRILVQSLVWMSISYFCVKKVWQKGLIEYSAAGK